MGILIKKLQILIDTDTMFTGKNQFEGCIMNRAIITSSRSITVNTILQMISHIL